MEFLENIKMPPKGWRKNAEGQYPQPNRASLVLIDDILFPRTTVQKLAKGIVDDTGVGGTMISKDSLIAIQRSATVFVSHILYHARLHLKDAGRKTVNAQDVFAALDDAEFSGFLPELRIKLDSYEEIALKKKAKRPAREKKDPEEITKKVKGPDGEVIKAENAEDVDDEDVEDEDEEPEQEEEGEDHEEEEEEEEEEENPIVASTKDEAELAEEEEIVDVGSESDDED